MIPIPYDSVTARLDALSEVLGAVNGALEQGTGEGDEWKPIDNPNRPAALKLQGELFEAITSLLSDARPTPSTGRRTS